MTQVEIPVPDFSGVTAAAASHGPALIVAGVIAAALAASKVNARRPELKTRIGHAAASPYAALLYMVAMAFGWTEFANHVRSEELGPVGEWPAALLVQAGVAALMSVLVGGWSVRRAGRHWFAAPVDPNAPVVESRPNLSDTAIRERLQDRFYRHPAVSDGTHVTVEALSGDRYNVRVYLRTDAPAAIRDFQEICSHLHITRDHEAAVSNGLPQSVNLVVPMTAVAQIVRAERLVDLHPGETTAGVTTIDSSWQARLVATVRTRPGITNVHAPIHFHGEQWTLLVDCRDDAVGRGVLSLIERTLGNSAWWLTHFPLGSGLPTEYRRRAYTVTPESAESVIRALTAPTA